MEFPQAGITLSGRRKGQPVRFWLTTAFIGVLVLSCLIATICQLFFPDGLANT
jgi:hypothetical protein